MEQEQPVAALSADALQKVFTEQLSILFCAKTHLIDALPGLIKNASFKDLKHALREAHDDTLAQMVCLKAIFMELEQKPQTEGCLAMNVMMDEARKQVIFNQQNLFASDMSIIFYMNAVENLQVGASQVLNTMAAKPLHLRYAQLVKESLDMNKDNAELFHHIAREYLEKA